MKYLFLLLFMLSSCAMNVKVPLRYDDDCLERICQSACYVDSGGRLIELMRKDVIVTCRCSALFSYVLYELNFNECKL